MDIVVVTEEGIEVEVEVDLAVMITNTVGLQGVHHTEVAGIIPQGAPPPMLEDLEGKGLGLFLILHMLAQIGGMLVGLGDVFRYHVLTVEVLRGKAKICVIVLVP